MSDSACPGEPKAGRVGTVRATGGGLTLLTNLVGEARGAQLALGLTSVLLGALTVGASYAEDGLPSRYTERCTVPATAPDARWAAFGNAAHLGLDSRWAVSRPTSQAWALVVC
jgi:hypothetical protein